ncbi:hypothetical protein E2C01_012121 [Portunus trituberculatus]|uniref:Uncharacterized protein n=1 Tax=Portunus trituberculatus TaxID=210409 RepID=A0A5B7DCV8_PORTR|nr:hypothetical protein [Portunus trituberculatus]
MCPSIEAVKCSRSSGCTWVCSEVRLGCCFGKYVLVF